MCDVSAFRLKRSVLVITYVGRDFDPNLFGPRNDSYIYVPISVLYICSSSRDLKEESIPR